MKRILTIAMLSIFLLTTGTYSYARGRGMGCCKANGGQAGCGMNYVDENGDGICDNAGTGKGKGAGKGYRNRLNNTSSAASAHGPNYVDKDGDGVCDNFKAAK